MCSRINLPALQLETKTQTAGPHGAMRMHLHVDILSSGSRNAWENFRVNRKGTRDPLTGHAVSLEVYQLP